MCKLDQIQNRIVPAAHNFGRVVHDYLEYRQDNELNNINEFQEWIIENGNNRINALNAAIAHSYPLGQSQCNIINLPLVELTQIVNQPDSFYSGHFLRSLIPGNINDAPTTLKCAFVVGMYNRTQQLTKAEFIEGVINRGWTTREGAAQAIRTVGNSVLKHFNLVDEEFRPNGRFALLFGC